MDEKEFENAWQSSLDEKTKKTEKSLLPPLVEANPASKLKAEKIAFRVWRFSNDSSTKKNNFLQPVNSFESGFWQRINYANCPINKNHAAPETGCSCGIYAFHTLEDAFYYASLWQIENIKNKYRGYTEPDYRLLNKDFPGEFDLEKSCFVVGVVRLKGKMFFDRTSYRAETGEILGLFDYSLLKKMSKAAKAEIKGLKKENYISKKELAAAAKSFSVPTIKEISQMANIFQLSDLNLKEKPTNSISTKLLSEVVPANTATDFFFQNHIISEFNKEEFKDYQKKIAIKERNLIIRETKD